MVVFNASFMMERELEDEFVSWLRGEVRHLDFGSGAFGALNPRISAMREAGGVDYREAEAQSVAFQVEFCDINAARQWSREVFATLAARFEEHFGPQAMVFTSVFEVIG